MYIDDILSINDSYLALLDTINIPQRTWNERNNRNSWLCLISWYLPQIWNKWSTFYLTLWQKRGLQFYHNLDKKSLKIPRGLSESVYLRKTDNTMAKRKSTKGQTMISTIYLDIPMIPMDGAYISPLMYNSPVVGI